ncbi:uncharacterized protein EV422DRAFT_106705 [Fimicolochytrium jonesii]|uniref:uncharacterized protein n=1 Tax=Fimicolochytrium jonesii TaxID=1396493 RepID=UPI0022FE8DD3|nr:uncharacterized protein EV422DRAFT_106705 [Fimicolochytrium jonesii]KAI8819768.1 hypothetical protein EV422DRAFT_106705 [Fimicolochytrium jonesii]
MADSAPPTSVPNEDSPPQGRTSKKKVGAKPNPFITDMPAWRREKNRKAQQALRERKAQELSRQQEDTRSLQTRISTLEQDNQQLRQLLALAFSAWFPQDTEVIGHEGVNDAVMLAARALAELRVAGSFRRNEEVVQDNQQPTTPSLNAPPSTCCPATIEPDIVSKCANSVPCFVLRDKILQYGAQVDMNALCEELIVPCSMSWRSVGCWQLDDSGRYFRPVPTSERIKGRGHRLRLR